MKREFTPHVSRLCMTDASGRARLIGIVILTRFLKLSLTRYEALIEKMEDAPMFKQLWPGTISTNLFPGAQVLQPGRSLTPNAIGQLRRGEESYYVSYRHPGLAREYLFDEGNAFYPPGEVQALRRQLRLINTRNRLTHLILMGIAEHQEGYLTSGDALHLKPLSQVTLAEWIRSETQSDGRFLPPGSRLEYVDNSLISRLTRTVSVLSPQGQDIPLRDFFPGNRELRKRMIAAILDEEKEQLRRGDIERAYTDEEIRERLQQRFGVSVSRRTVSACRRAMRIPSSYVRNSNHIYPPRGVNFSFHYPLDKASVKVNAPQVPGVYEISLADGEVDYPLSSSRVVYIGSTKNLRKRLGDHLGPTSKNGDLRRLLADLPAGFRYIVTRHPGGTSGALREPGDVRAVEKMLCQCFISAHGSLPRYNRIRP